MPNTFQVAIHFDKSYGRIEYDPQTKAVQVILDNPVKRKQVEEFLAQPRNLYHSRTTLQDFEVLEIKPLDSLENIKLALTKLWENTEVYVDWSRPVDDKYRV